MYKQLLTQVLTLATISFLVATLLAQQNQEEKELSYLKVEEVLAYPRFHS